MSDDDSSIAKEQVQPQRAAPTSQPVEGENAKRQGVRELVDMLNKQSSANAETNKTNSTRGGHRKAQPKRQSSAPARIRKKSKSPERPERAILDPMRIMTSPLRMRAQSISPDRDRRTGGDIPSPREGSPKASMSRSSSADSKPFLREIYENPKRRPLSDIIRQFSGDTDAPKMYRSHSSPPQRRTSKLGGRPIQPREGSPPRFGERLGSRVSVIDDDMFRKEGSIRMAKGKGKRIGWTDRTDESADSLDNLDDDEKKERSRRNKRGPVREEEIKAHRAKPRESSAPAVLVARKSRSSSRSGSDVDEEPFNVANIARSKSPVFDTFEGKLLASTPVESASSLSSDYLSSSPFIRDDPDRRSYDEASLIAEKEFRNEPNFELRRRPSPKQKRETKGKYEVQPDTPPQKRSKREKKSKSRGYSSSNESEQEVSMELGSEMDSRSEASSIDLSPVAGVSQDFTDEGQTKPFEAVFCPSIVHCPHIHCLLAAFYHLVI